MNEADLTANADSYWAAHFGIARDRLFSKALNLVAHHGELSDYPGIFALFREGAAIISIPSRAEFLRPLLSRQSIDFTPAAIASELEPYASKTIGPAVIAYTNSVHTPGHSVRELTSRDEPAVVTLKAACADEEWEHGGIGSLTRSTAGVFNADQLAALASYEIWGGSIAHISIITQPEYRGRGFGAAAVAYIAARALADGLLPQYRTLESNAPSMRIANSLGFTKYASSLAVRLKD